MTKRILLLVAALLVIAPGARAQQLLAGEPELKATHGDWQIYCNTDDLGAQQCFMGQALDEETSGRRALTAMVLKAPDGSVALRMTVPLGVLIPAGVNLTIDAADIGDVGYVACFPDGCMTQVGLSPEVLAQLKGGVEAVVTVQDFDGQPIALPLSLSGFTAAFDAF